MLPYLVAINLTSRCNLACAHCYLDAHKRARAGDELGYDEVAGVLADLASRAPGTIVVLTGGEPLLWPRLDELVALGTELGLRVVLGTNGMLLDEARVRRLKGLGLSGVGVSIDAVSAPTHDSFRGAPGSFERACRATRLCVAHGLHAQLHFTVTRETRTDLGEVVQLAQALGASIVHFFFLVCVGRGERRMDLNPAEYEQCLLEIADLQAESHGIMVQTRCTPHFKRVLYQRDPAAEFTRAQGYDGGGCPAATHYARIDPRGNVTPCPYMEVSGGNVRTDSFWDVWDRSPLFETLRSPERRGTCGACDFKALCGGCRARSYLANGDLLGADPSCAYTPPPTAAPIQLPAADSAGEVRFTTEAEDRLGRVPLFVRRFLRRRLEASAREAGVTVVTTALMDTHRARRESELGCRFGDMTRPPTPRSKR